MTDERARRAAASNLTVAQKYVNRALSICHRDAPSYASNSDSQWRAGGLKLANDWLQGWSDGYGDAKAGSPMPNSEIARMPEGYQKGYRDGARERWEFEQELKGK